MKFMRNPNAFKMLLFGFLLLSTVSAVSRRIPEGFRAGICIQAGKVKWVAFWWDIEDTSCDYRNIGYKDDWRSELRLKERDIESFNWDWYHLAEYDFRSLSLDRNKIVEITREILNYLPSATKKVSMRDNMIERLNKTVIRNKHVIKLDLTNNSISVIENEALQNMQQLHYLYLQLNQLTDTKFAATLPLRLRDLWLGYNPISVISEGSFSNLVYLKRLMLEGTQITTIQHWAFRGLGQLEVLDLSLNAVKNVDADSFKSTPKLKVAHCGNFSKNLNMPNKELIDMDDILTSCKNRQFIISSRHL